MDKLNECARCLTIYSASQVDERIDVDGLCPRCNRLVQDWYDHAKYRQLDRLLYDIRNS